MDSQPATGHYFVIAQRQEQGISWPILWTAAGDAIAMFTSADRADAFHQGRVLGPQWLVEEMGSEAFLAWLRHNLLDGVHLLLVDPPAEGAESRALPIFRVLVEAEGVPPTLVLLN